MDDCNRAQAAGVAGLTSRLERTWSQAGLPARALQPFKSLRCQREYPTLLTVTDLRERIQASLGDQFEIERELEGGGMSRVFVAKDTQLDRRVVVKLLRPELALGVSVDRFRREILVAASLQHPLIVPVLAAGEIDGLPYFLMPFVDGESLRAKLQRTGSMTVPETVRVLRDVARALVVAHGRGIVHRDIKPDNVLLANDAAVVADFGVAKAFASARAGENSPSGEHPAITTVGTSLGTPAYMAPEQVAADPNAGSGIDIYAFGVMAYEMLAGKPPFAGKAPQSIMAAHIAEQPVPLGYVRPTAPAALSALVMRCLSKEARDRPDAATLQQALEDPAVVSGSFPPVSDSWSSTQLTGAAMSDTSGTASVASASARSTPTSSVTPSRTKRLAWISAVAAVTLVGSVGLYASYGAGAEADAAAAAKSSTTISLPPSVAILPFVYLGADSAQAWTAQAVSDAITNGVSTLQGVRVASRGSAESLQRRIAVGDTGGLPVRTLVEGVLEQEGKRLRLSVRLVDAVDGFTIFSDRHEADVGGLFAMEDVVAESIREMLREHFSLPRPARLSS